jgi:uncharacterized protein YkwD
MPPAPPLSFDPALRAAARRHATDLAEHDFISHLGSDGSRPEQRIRDAGYRTKKVIGENVAVVAVAHTSRRPNYWLSRL